MSMDVSSFIEVYTLDYDGCYPDKESIKKLGNFKVDDVVLVYNDNQTYYKIKNIYSINKQINYEPVQFSDDIETAMKERLEIKPVFKCYKLEDLPSKNEEVADGTIYRCWDNHQEIYMKKIFLGWVTLDKCPGSWKQIRWKDKNNYFISGISSFVSEHIYGGGFTGCGPLTDRGLPNDVCRSTKDEIDPNDLHVTYCTLDEINNYVDMEKQKMHENICKYLNTLRNTDLSEKMDYIIDIINKSNRKHVPNESNDYSCDDYAFNDMIDELVSNYISACNESTRIFSLVNAYYGYMNGSNVRVIYTFNN